MATKDEIKIGDPKTKLSYILWTKSLPIREKALGTYFVQGLKTGKLLPETFGAFNVQDSIYLFKQQINIQTAASKATDPAEKKYLEAKILSYQTLYLKEFKKWHIDNPEGIKLGQPIKEYTEYLEDIAKNKEPIYFLIAMIPCLKMWPWLGKLIADGDHGIFKPWTSNNMDPNYVGYEKLDKFMDDADAKGIIARDVAEKIYDRCTIGEYNFFDSIV